MLRRGSLDLKRVGWERAGRNEGRGFLEKGVFLNLSWKDE